MGIALDKNNSGVGDGSTLDGVRHLSLGISWDASARNKGGFVGKMSRKAGADLDLFGIVMQGTKPVRMVSGMGDLIDPLKDRSLVHSGDNTTGAGDGDDETIDAHLDRIDLKYTGIIFVVVAGFKGGLKEKLSRDAGFQGADNVEFSVYDKDPGQLDTVSILPSLLGNHNACLIAKVSRTDAAVQSAPWKIEVMEEMVRIDPGNRDSLINQCMGR